jgi:hypothetical protein
VPVLRKRDRQIAFRVSEEEYLALQAACLQCNSRSVSDLVRESVLKVVMTGSLTPFDPGLAETPPRLQGRVGMIEQVLDRLMLEVGELKKKLDPSSDLACHAADRRSSRS